MSDQHAENVRMDEMIRLGADAILEDDDLIELPSQSAPQAARVVIEALLAAGYAITPPVRNDGSECAT